MVKKCVFAGIVLGLLAASAAVAAEPIVYYTFDDPGPSVIDESGNGNDGTVHGNVLLDDGGYLGKCFAFNGTDSYVELTRVIQDSFTIGAWIKTSTPGRAGSQAYEGSGIFWSDVAGVANDFVVASLGTKLSFFCGNPDTSVNSNGDVVTGEWVYITAVRDTVARTIAVYINGVLDRSVAHSNTGPLNAQSQFMIGANTLDSRYYTGLIDEVRLFGVALTEEEIRKAMTANQAQAQEPVPEDKAADVPRDAGLSWAPNEFAATHDVYLGTAFADVNTADRANPMGVLVSQGQADTAYVPENLLGYGQTYYWRIDEVNAPPDSTIFKGAVWSFTVEPFSYPVTPSAATASGSGSNMGPQNTINGSGLNADDQHSTESTHMWMSSAVKPVWIQYEFDQVYKLDKLLVWNSNQLIETFLGFGARNVTIDYSVDGQTWATLDGVPEFAKATASPTYTANTTVDFGGVEAKFVKLTINANWGGVAPQSGLSEVRFFYVPVQAFAPQPADNAVDVPVDTALNWRPGREVESHQVYLGADENALTLVDTTAEHSHMPTSLDLGTTYFWQVNEVGGAGPYEGEVWSFTTEEYVTVDDFESYNDDDNRIYDAWIDGLTDPAKGGSQVGYDASPFAEKTVIHGGKQSMPLMYDNTAAANSEATLTFDAAQDWTQHGVTTLVVYFRGQVTNAPASLYVKINTTKVPFGNNAATAMPLWRQWSIPLAATGANLKSVKSLTLGVEGSGTGTVFIDDIRLYATAPEAVNPADPGTAGLAALYTMNGNVQDSSGKNYHGTIRGDASYEPGYAGQALVFNGTNAYVDLPIGPLMNSLTDTTVATHVYFGGGSGSWQRIFDFGSGSGTAPYMFLSPRQGTAGNMRFAIRSATVAEQIVNSPGPMTVGWHHTAVVIDSQAKTVTLYLDGEPVASAATTVLPKDMGNTTQNWIGRSQYAADAYFFGSIDDFRIYNRVLSEGELRYLAGDR